MFFHPTAETVAFRTLYFCKWNRIRKIKPYTLGYECGTLCEIKPCGEECENKSYLGELPITIATSYDKDTGVLKNRAVNNPAIFVPELKKIIYGCESWWRKIESADDSAGISDNDIENTWYVDLMKKLKE